MAHVIKPQYDGIIVYVGYKKDGTKTTFNLRHYTFAETETLKHMQVLEKKIISKLGNKKIYTHFTRDIITLDKC